MARAKVISFINYKGGTGKTTSTYHIGCSLAQHHGKKVLLIDIDPQTNLTFLCSTVTNWQKFKQQVGTIASLYRTFRSREYIDIGGLIWRSPISIPGGKRLNRLDLIPGDLDLFGEDFECDPLGEEQIFAPTKAERIILQRSFIRSVVRQIEGEYDFILIDCPPDFYLLTQNALLASDIFVVTVIPDYLSTLGLTTLLGKVKWLTERLSQVAASVTGKRYSSSVVIPGGILFVKVRTTGSGIARAHEQTMNHIKRILIGQNERTHYVFRNFTTELIGYSEAGEERLPVWECRTSNARRAARQYQKITEEFLLRFA